MTHRIGDVIVITPEPARECELCGKVEECRPYGPKGEQVCFTCGMKDRAAVDRAIDQRFNPQ